MVIFPEAYQKSSSQLEPGTLVLVRGKLERDTETVRLLAADVLPIAALRERLAQEVAIRVTPPVGREVFESLGEIFSRHRGDRRVLFELEVPAGARPLRVRAEVSAQVRVKPSSTLAAEVEQLVGHGSIQFR